MRLRGGWSGVEDKAGRSEVEDEVGGGRCEWGPARGGDVGRRGGWRVVLTIGGR